jgi:hypothetical protein
MRPILRFACATVSILLGACVCSVMFSVLSPVSASCSDLLSIINIIILCVVFVMICASGIVNYYIVYDPRSSRKNLVDLTFCCLKVSMDASNGLHEADLCSICLASLIEKRHDICEMNCCKNMVHSKCMRDYLSSYLAENNRLPCCVFCRAGLTLAKSLTV